MSFYQLSMSIFDLHVKKSSKILKYFHTQSTNFFNGQVKVINRITFSNKIFLLGIKKRPEWQIQEEKDQQMRENYLHTTDTLRLRTIQLVNQRNRVRILSSLLFFQKFSFQMYFDQQTMII